MSSKTTFLIIFLLVTLTGNCQDYKNEIEKVFAKYSNAKVNKDFKDLVNYMPDECFEKESKDQIISAMEKSVNNSDVEVELKESRIIEIADSKRIEGKYYSILRYSKKINMRFKRKTDSQETEEDYKTITDLRKALFEAKYGEKNVTFNDVTKFLEIVSEERACAISTNARTNWKLIFIEEVQKSALEKILPRQLIDGLQNSR